MTFLDALLARRSIILENSLVSAYRFVEALGNPHLAYPTIHVTGTNGKGSVATKIAKALTLSGYKTGLYTSPHLNHYSERICIDGIPIETAILEKEIERLFVFAEQLDPTACCFDLTTYLAFEHFCREQVDIAVIEVGIGGLYDTTNVVEPVLSVITSISSDHLSILGPTLDDVARQKAGIIKAGVPVVIGPHAQFGPILEQAQRIKAPVHQAPAAAGYFDFENRAIAREALKVLSNSFSLLKETIEEALLVRPPCRFEELGGVIFDVAHNPDGIEHLCDALEYHYPRRPFVAVIGMSQDKEVEKSLNILAKRAQHLFLAAAPIPRAASPAWMASLLPQDQATAAATVEEALDLALAAQCQVIVCGSFYIMQKARDHVMRSQVSLT